LEEGAAAMILEKDLTGSLLAEKIVYFAQNPAATAKMAQKIRKFGHPKAAQNIVDDICRLIGRPIGQNNQNKFRSA
jgi:UDP-N-acetylglucosamine:LPS N-acetylglucosamine transferase